MARRSSQKKFERLTFLSAQASDALALQSKIILARLAIRLPVQGGTRCTQRVGKKVMPPDPPQVDCAFGDPIYHRLRRSGSTFVANQVERVASPMPHLHEMVLWLSGDHPVASLSILADSRKALGVIGRSVRGHRARLQLIWGPRNLSVT